MYADSPHMVEWMSRRNSFRVIGSVSAESETYLASLPWASSRVDWMKLRDVRFEIIERSSRSCQRVASRRTRGTDGNGCISPS